MDRRTFIRSGLAGAGALALGPTFWQQAYAAPVRPGKGPYGPLLAPDANGIMLPKGFRSRLLAEGGAPVPGTVYPWHAFPDGGATFRAPGGGWYYVSNSETPGTGGASSIGFAADGAIVSAQRILSGTNVNCGGGPTPWGTWLSCEEHDLGKVWECDPAGVTTAAVRPALGTFKHEAAAVDPVGKAVYLTEDQTDGAFYRFRPTSYPNLSSGVLEAARVEADRSVTWLPVPDPAFTGGTPTRRQTASTPFNGGEGVWYDSGRVYFTTKGTNQVFVYTVGTSRLKVLYDDSMFPNAPLTGVDNCVVATRSGDLFVAEDGGNMEIVMITRDRVVAPLLRVVGQDSSELAGPAFSPAGNRLYFSSQRGGGGQGLTYEVKGPFRS